jgi:hypothetical protein
MGFPGFTAASSLYRSQTLYRTATLSPIQPYSMSNRNAPPQHPCGASGQICCHAPASVSNVYGPLVHCNTGLGCDINSDQCVQPCGGPGQACCDGPETRALEWTTSGLVYSPTQPGLREMCDQGACDVPTHRCFSCGGAAGVACCPPDASHATARCTRDEHLMCQFDSGTFASGICVDCGSQGKPPCPWGCDANLDIRNGVCDLCGANFQPPCDRTWPAGGCNLGLSIAQGVCRYCGAEGQIPCDSGCNPGLSIAQGVCRHCGAEGQIPCDSGCRSPLNIQNGLCEFCGGDRQRPCDSGCDAGLSLAKGQCRHCGSTQQIPCDQGCKSPLRLANGVCLLCGANQQIPCDSGGCNPGLEVVHGVCTTVQSSPQGCANIGENCVSDNVSGTHCCHDSGPTTCNYGFCKACVPHDQECLAHGTYICCSETDYCILDQFSGKTVCGIPDVHLP